MKYLTLVIVIVMSLGVVGVAAAQEPEEAPAEERPGRGPRGGDHIVLETVAEALGLEPEELHELLEENEDATLADVIIAQGGDVDEIQALVIAAISERQDEVLDNLEEHIDELFNSSLPLRGGDRPGGRDGRPGNRPGVGRGFGQEGEGRPQGEGNDDAPVAPQGNPT